MSIYQVESGPGLQLTTVQKELQEELRSLV